jgi:hypothetical protein
MPQSAAPFTHKAAGCRFYPKAPFRLRRCWQLAGRRRQKAEGPFAAHEVEPGILPLWRESRRRQSLRSRSPPPPLRTKPPVPQTAAPFTHKAAGCRSPPPPLRTKRQDAASTPRPRFAFGGVGSWQLAGRRRQKAEGPFAAHEIEPGILPLWGESRCRQSLRSRSPPPPLRTKRQDAASTPRPRSAFGGVGSWQLAVGRAQAAEGPFAAHEIEPGILPLWGESRCRQSLRSRGPPPPLRTKRQDAASTPRPRSAFGGVGSWQLAVGRAQAAGGRSPLRRP